MGRRIVWEDVDIRMYLDGAELGFYFATRFEFTADIVVDSGGSVEAVVDFGL